MDARLVTPNELDMDKVATLLAMCGQMALDFTGEVLDCSDSDLPRLQTVYHTLSNLDEIEYDQKRLALQSIGIALGQVIAKANTGFDWWVISDEQGRDPCLRYENSDLLVYPQTLISKRVENAESVNIKSLYSDLTEQLTTAIATIKPDQLS